MWLVWGDHSVVACVYDAAEAARIAKLVDGTVSFEKNLKDEPWVASFVFDRLVK